MEPKNNADTHKLTARGERTIISELRKPQATYDLSEGRNRGLNSQ